MSTVCLFVEKTTKFCTFKVQGYPERKKKTMKYEQKLVYVDSISLDKYTCTAEEPLLLTGMPSCILEYATPAGCVAGTESGISTHIFAVMTVLSE